MNAAENLPKRYLTAGGVETRRLGVVVGEKAVLSEETVTIKPGLVVPRSITSKNLKVGEFQTLAFDLEIELVEAEWSYMLRSITIRSDWPRHVILPSDIRAISVAELLSAANLLWLPLELSEQIGRRAKSFYLDAKAGDRDELLRIVALRAAVARLLSGEPNLELVECFDVTPRTASRWISEAREKGLLD